MNLYVCVSPIHIKSIIILLLPKMIKGNNRTSWPKSRKRLSWFSERAMQHRLRRNTFANTIRVSQLKVPSFFVFCFLFLIPFWNYQVMFSNNIMKETINFYCLRFILATSVWQEERERGMREDNRVGSQMIRTFSRLISIAKSSESPSPCCLGMQYNVLTWSQGSGYSPDFSFQLEGSTWCWIKPN